MLEPAYLHRAVLPDLYARALFDPRAAYFTLGGYADYKLEVAENEWSTIQRVSVGGGVVGGYLAAQVDREVRQVRDLSALAFRGAGQRIGLLFSRDLVRFVAGLVLDYGFERVAWSVVVGNPAEQLYDRVLPKLGGRVSAQFRRCIRRPNGSLTDQKCYEVIPPELTSDQRAQIAAMR